MRLRRFPKSTRNSRGQALVETALVTPLLVLLILNAVNFAYFFLVMLNLTAASRTAVEYAIMGPSTPAENPYPSVGPADATAAGKLTVSYVAQQDMTGAIWSPTTQATIQICSIALGIDGTTGLANCQNCTGTTCTGINSGTTAPPADPGNFVLNQVKITYSFKTLIPGKIFNLALAATPICNTTGNCTFVRQANMRNM